jgi:hypothetical protein
LRPYRGLRTPLIPMRQLKELIERGIEPNQELEIKSINSRYKKSGMANRRIRKGSKGGSFCGEGVLK